MKNSLSIIILFCVVFFSCKKKDLPESEPTAPEFVASFEVQGNAVKLEAGNNDYYMNSSHYWDTLHSLYVCKGDLRQKTFQMGGGYALTILFNDTKTGSAAAAMSIDSALILGDHLYNDMNTSGLTQRVDFTPIKAYDANADYHWSVYDGSTTKNYTGTYGISPNLEIGKTYSVSFNAKDASGVCDARHTNVFKAGSKLQTNVTITRDLTIPEMRYKLSYDLPGYASSFRCRWDFGDNTTSTVINPTKLYQPGTYTVGLTLVDKNMNDSCISYYQLNATNGVACDANYFAKFNNSIQNNRLYSSVTILLTDPNGKVYSSHDLVQPQSSLFQILSVSDYLLNDAGQPTKRVKVKFNCVLNHGTESISLTNGEAVIAVSYK